MTALAPDVGAAVRARWTGRGVAWADALTAELEALCAKFGVTPRRTYPARFAFVVQAVTATGAALVLRSSPDPDAGHQAAVLRRLSGVGLAPRLHAVEATPTAIWTISDAVEPGTALRDATPEQLSHTDVMAVLRVLAENHPGPLDAPDLAPWIRSRLTSPPLHDMPPGKEPATEQERRVAIDLLDTIGPLPAARLCHGDLSPGNALIGRDRLWLVDPRGINGEPAYDIAVAALKACRDGPADGQRAAVALARAADADPDRAAHWVPIAAAARI